MLFIIVGAIIGFFVGGFEGMIVLAIAAGLLRAWLKRKFLL